MHCGRMQPGALLVAAGAGVLLAACLPAGVWRVLLGAALIAAGCLLAGK